MNTKTIISISEARKNFEIAKEVKPSNYYTLTEKDGYGKFNVCRRFESGKKLRQCMIFKFRERCKRNEEAIKNENTKTDNTQELLSKKDLLFR